MAINEDMYGFFLCNFRAVGLFFKYDFILLFSIT